MKRSALRSNPETLRAWEVRSRARARSREAKREPIGARKGPPRRTRAPLPLPPVDGSPATLHESQGEAVAFGPQAELCRRTMCAACYALECWSLRIPLRWERLPLIEWGTGMRSHAHHEPKRGNPLATPDGMADDDDTLPLCPPHHEFRSRGLVCRHDYDHKPEVFYEAVFIPDWTAVRDEMRRRTAALQGTTP